MAYLVTAASICSFAPDRRYSWWNRLIGSLARLGRALVAERGRRRTTRRRPRFDDRLMTANAL